MFATIWSLIAIASTNRSRMLFSVFCEPIRSFHLSSVLDFSIRDFNKYFDLDLAVAEWRDDARRICAVDEFLY